MISKLINEIKKKEAPIVVGLDPQLSFIPEHILSRAYDEAGKNLKGIALAITEYNKGIIDAVYDLVPAVKPQIAMYEQFGIEGLIAYAKTCEYAKSKGLIVIGDVKRGDIGSTSAAYATAHLGFVEIDGVKFTPFEEDFATVNPYLGTDGIKPFIDVCNANDKGIFVLVKTSNPSSGELQDKRLFENGGEGRPVYELMGEMVNNWGLTSMDGDYSNVGAVVGATYPEMAVVLRKIMKKSFILVPGYGAQGGKGKDLKPFFNEDGLGAIVNSSRGIIAAYKNEAYAKFGPEGYAEASRAAVLDMKEDIRTGIN